MKVTCRSDSPSVLISVVPEVAVKIIVELTPLFVQVIPDDKRKDMPPLALALFPDIVRLTCAWVRVEV